MWDVKLTRPVSGSAIIAGPYEDQEEARMHATRLRLQDRDSRAAKVKEFETTYPENHGITDPAEIEEYEFDKKMAKRSLDKWLADTETKFEVVAHKAGGRI